MYYHKYVLGQQFFTVLSSGGGAAIMWRCLREGVIDRWIQANHCIQDIIRWLDFMVSYNYVDSASEVNLASRQST